MKLYQTAARFSVVALATAASTLVISAPAYAVPYQLMAGTNCMPFSIDTTSGYVAFATGELVNEESNSNPSHHLYECPIPDLFNANISTTNGWVRSSASGLAVFIDDESTVTSNDSGGFAGGSTFVQVCVSDPASTTFSCGLNTEMKTIANSTGQMEVDASNGTGSNLTTLQSHSGWIASIEVRVSDLLCNPTCNSASGIRGYKIFY